MVCVRVVVISERGGCNDQRERWCEAGIGIVRGGMNKHFALELKSFLCAVHGLIWTRWAIH